MPTGNISGLRCFEFTGGTSEKFWDVSRDDVTVTVRFGRLGTNGQTKVKELASAAAAEAHEGKLIAEKLAKGYVEGDAPAATVAAPTAPPAPPPPPIVRATPVATMPEAWRAEVSPIRGVDPGPEIVLVADAAAKVEVSVAQHVQHIQIMVADPDSDRALADRLGRYAVGGFSERDAVAAGMVLGLLPWTKGAATAAIDDLVIRHGVVFMAEACARSSEVRRFDPRFPTYEQTGDPRAVGPSLPDTLTSNLGPVARQRALQHIAASDDDTYAEVVEVLGERRRGHISARLTTSALAPGEPGWMAADLAELEAAAFPAVWVQQRRILPLLAVAPSVAEAASILKLSGELHSVERELLTSMAVHLGAGSAALLARVYDQAVPTEVMREALDVLAQVPGDEALAELLARADRRLVRPALTTASRRDPRRSVPLLAAAAASGKASAVVARSQLRDLVLAEPAAVGEVEPSLDPQAVTLIEELRASVGSVPEATPDRLPAVLVDPPWAGKRAKGAVKALSLPVDVVPPTTAYAPGEAEAIVAAADDGYRARWPTTEESLQEAIAAGDSYQLRRLTGVPDDVAARYLDQVAIRSQWLDTARLSAFLVRQGDAAAPLVFRVAAGVPVTHGSALLPLVGTEVALRVAEWLAQAKSMVPLALTWLERHHAFAAVALVPLAVGKAGKERTAAGVALRALASAGHADEVVAAAAAHGAEAAAAVQAVLDLDPLLLLPAKIPALPVWLEVELLPPVLLADRSAALPAEAVRNLLTTWALSKPGETYAGVDLVHPLLDRASLAELGWAVFDRWVGAEHPSKEAWALDALALVGDDETARRLAPLVRAWPGEAAHKRAVIGLDVLTAIGSDVALMNLHGIAQKVKFKALKAEAQARMAEVADRLGLSADQLADRLVPDFGLDPDGTTLLDYGPRQFRVGFDEQLRPTVSDPDGKPRRTLPKPGASDDPTSGPAAWARFSALKKDVKTVAADQVRRLERAMVDGRRWTGAEHRELFVEHPLVWHLARRLVWATFDSDGVPLAAFRVAEDRTYADAGDEVITIADDATVGIAHPLHLGEALAGWAETFVDYEILQPFPQLDREVFALTAEEAKAKVLHRLDGVVFPVGKVLGLAHRGWERSTPEDAGIQNACLRQLPDGRTAVMDLAPGIAVGMVMELPEQQVTGVWLNDGPASWGRAEGNLVLGTMDPVTASEVLRDLEALRP